MVVDPFSLCWITVKDVDVDATNAMANVATTARIVFFVEITFSPMF